MAYLLPLATIALMIVILLPLREKVEPGTIALLFFLPVGACAALGGLGPGILSAVIAFFSLNFFFISPYASLLVHKSQDLVALFIFLILAIFISQLVGRLITSLAIARSRENDTTSLYALSQLLSRSKTINEILENEASHCLETFHAQSVEIQIRVNRKQYLVQQPGGENDDSQNRGKPAVIMPLQGSSHVAGEIRLWRSNWLIREAKLHLLRAFAQQAAMAIERAVLAEQARQADLLQVTEKLQSSLLNSISHDLRTPLVSITGALSSLREKSLSLDQEARESLVDTAIEEAERLNRLVGNLLNMTRLEAGAISLKKEPCDIQDAVGAAIEQLGERISHRKIKVNLPPDLELIPLDFALFEQVLVNILDNAAKYSSPDSMIKIDVRSVSNQIEIKVSDRGIGIPEEDLTRVFDKFYRVQRPDNVSGTGLGLAICKGIIEAHGGRITAEDRQGGGTIITMILPKEQQS